MEWREIIFKEDMETGVELRLKRMQMNWRNYKIKIYCNELSYCYKKM